MKASALAVIALLALTACATRQIAHLDLGDADETTVTAVRAALSDLGFRVRPVDISGHEPGPNRVVYGHEVDIAAVGYRLHQVLGDFVQTAPTVRGTHFYSPRNMGVYLARASLDAPREFSGLCGDHFTRVLLWQQGIARIEVQAWDEARGGFLADRILVAEWRGDPLEVLDGDGVTVLGVLAEADADGRYPPPLQLAFEPFDQHPCRLPERRVPDAISPRGTHRANADQM